MELLFGSPSIPAALLLPKVSNQLILLRSKGFEALL